MQAVILAGGKGTRLKDLTKEVPKPMLPIAGKPLLEYQVELCKRYGIEEVIILVNHLKGPIMDHFGDGHEFGIPISYFEEPEPLGTVGGIKEIEDRITADFLVLYGDVMINMHLEKFKQFHFNQHSECTIALHPNDHPYDSDLVDIDKHGRVTAFYPKPHERGTYYRNLVNAGAYIFSKAIFKCIEKGKKADFGREVFPRIYQDIQMYGYNTAEYLKDMGTPDRLERVEHDVMSGRVERSSYEHKQKTIFLDRDGVINPDKHLIYKPDDLELYPFTAEAIKKINGSGFLSVVATNQSVVARNLCSEKELRVVHNKLDTLLGEEHAKLDALYYCPHHPDKGYPEENPDYKIDCDCRKPKPGMLLDAAEAFNIDLGRSYFIGDSERDIVAGKKAGVTTIGVKTGKGLKTAEVLPDYFFLNLKEAVDFVVDDPYRDKCREIGELIKRSGKKPFVMVLAGNTRSGKSTFSTRLQKHLKQSGFKTLKIELDDWILAKKDRKPGSNVFGNFQMPQLVNDVQRILDGKEVKIHGYARHPDREPVPSTYKIHDEDVILIEGIVALGDETLRSAADLKLFKYIDSKDLRTRLEQFYQWKGYTGKEIDKLYFTRKANEYDIIERHIDFADMVI